MKDYIRKGLVTVNGSVVRAPEQRIDETCDRIALNGEPLTFCRFVYYMLNKPQGVVSATRDLLDRTVLELLPEEKRAGLFPVGRLDKDTEGLLILTNDGELAHRLLSPKRHVEKVYAVRIQRELSPEEIGRLSQGIDIGDDKPTAPAKVEVLGECEILLTIHEGRYHQVKRMLKAVGNEVLSLKRICFGRLQLDDRLSPGQSRELTKEEVALLHES